VVIEQQTRVLIICPLPLLLLGLSQHAVTADLITFPATRANRVYQEYAGSQPFSSFCVFNIVLLLVFELLDAS
jgi:hypothetical protein